MTSSEGSSAGGVPLPDSTTPFMGMHPSPGGIHEEQDGETTPVPVRRNFRAETGDMSTPASSRSEIPSILTASDDDTRHATKRELNLLRLSVRTTITSLREYLTEELQRRDALDTLTTNRLAALEAQASFQRGALAESRDQSARLNDEIFKMMQDLNDTLTHTRALATGPPTTPGPRASQAQADNPSSQPGTSLLGEVIQAGAVESLTARIESLSEAVAASVSDLRGQVLTVTDQLGDRIQEIDYKIQTLEESTAAAAADAAGAAAMILAVDSTAQEAVAKLSQQIESSDSSWSDWDLLEDPEFCGLRGRVEALEAGAATGPADGNSTPLAKLDEALERIADLEGRGPGGYIGGVPRSPPPQRGRANASVMDSKVVVALGPLTDDKNAYKQWDLKLLNALNYIHPGYAKALERLKQGIDRGEDLDDVRPGASADSPMVFGTALVERLKNMRGEGTDNVDVDQLDADLEFILIDKAKAKSDILQRITNLKGHGGVRMYAEVYKWFTETSGQGLMEQMQAMMDPKPASKEEETAEAIEAWEEKMNRLARYGEEYKLPETGKKVALKKILIGKIRDHFELWEFESPKPTFETLLKRAKDQARSKKLDRDVQRGRTGVSLGANQANTQQWQDPACAHVPPQQHQVGDVGGTNELNAFQKGKKGKGKGKGGDGGKSGKGGGKKGAAPRPPPVGGCFICKGKHWVNECPHNTFKKGQQGQVEHGRSCEEVRIGAIQQVTDSDVQPACSPVQVPLPDLCMGHRSYDHVPNVPVRNTFEDLAEHEDDREGPPCELPPSPVAVRRWSRNASRRKPKVRFMTSGCSCEDDACNHPGQTIESTALLQEVRVDQINGCNEEVEEWEEIELLVDSGASATVIGKDEVRAVKATDPDPNKHYKLADGSTIPNLGVKDFRAVTEDNKPLSLKAQVTDVDKPLLSVAHIVHNGGKVVFSPEANYIEHKSKSGGIRRDNLIFRDGLYMIKLWVPRDQGAPFTGQA